MAPDQPIDETTAPLQDMAARLGAHRFREFLDFMRASSLDVESAQQPTEIQDIWAEMVTAWGADRARRILERGLGEK